MREAAKCAHEACECTVPPHGPFGKYCSDHCREAHGFAAFRCGCHHDECDRAAQKSAAQPAQKPA